VISEAAYSRDFASFWRQATPLMDGFVRRLNRGIYSRDFEPMTAETLPNRRAFINEIAFLTFCRLVETAQSGKNFSIDLAIERSVDLVSDLVFQEMRTGNYDKILSEIETSDVKIQVERLSWKLLRNHKITEVSCRPGFMGCGIVDKCAGDVLIKNTLYEIKAGDRFFRSIDFRQVLIYLALNRVGNPQSIENIGLVNPRVGISFEMSVEEFSFEISGRDSISLMDSVVYGMSSGDVSR
jgi:hypothetical protein